ALLLVLAWMAASDGQVAETEMRNLRTVAAKGQSPSDLQQVLAIANRSNLPDLQLAFEILGRVTAPGRPLLLKMAIGMALEDGYLTTGEGHIIRLLADVLEQSAQDVDNLFREMTGTGFPPPA